MTTRYKRKPLSALTDEALVKLIQGGCEESEFCFSILMKRHQKILLAFCFSRLLRQEDAEDAMQESFIRAYRFINDFQHRCSLKTWLINIAANECNSILHRSRKWTKITMLQHDSAEEYITDSVDVLDRISEVKQILESMPIDSRDILQLRFHKEMPLKSIAYTLGISLSASKMRLYRALEQFEARQKQAA